MMAKEPHTGGTLMLEWLIVGGGIHGTYMANVLVQETHIPLDQIRIIDPFEKPLHRWRQNTVNCGMEYLRSPSVHNLDIPILSLYHFAKTWKGDTDPAFVPKYFRPALTLFNDHCDEVIRQNKLDTLRITARVTAIRQEKENLAVVTAGETFTARHVILCIGNSDQPSLPSWAADMQEKNARIHHVFDPAFHRADLPDAEHTLVLGGGITAAQLALCLSRQLQGRVSLCSRHGIRHHELDFDPCWVGPKCLNGFEKTPYAQRRSMIGHARNRGSIPTDVRDELNKARARGRLTFIQANIIKAWQHGDRIVLTGRDKTLEVDQVILATGFDEYRPGGILVDQLVRDLALPTEICGYPILEKGILWGKNIFVTGPLAELGLGPCARNIIGVRRAGRELLKHFRETHTE